MTLRLPLGLPLGFARGALRLGATAFLLLAQAPAFACARCFSDSPYHTGLVIATLMMMPIPVLVALGVIRAARRAAREARQDLDPDDD